MVSARFRAGDGFIDQVRLAWGYALAASGGPGVDRPAGAAEATFVFGQRVTALPVVAGRVVAVTTHDGAIAAPLVVLATGPFLGRTAALAGVEVPIAPTRRQKVIVPDAPEVPQDAPMTIDEATGAHWRPALGGAYALLTEPGTPPTDPLWSVPTSSDFAFRLLDPASPDGVALVSPFWADVWERGANWLLQAGQYEYTPDHRPFVGADAGRRAVAERRLERPRGDGQWRRQPPPDRRDHRLGRAGPSWGLRADALERNPFRLDRPWRPAGTTSCRTAGAADDRGPCRSERAARWCVRAPGTGVPEWCADAPDHRRRRVGTDRPLRCREPGRRLTTCRNATPPELPGASVTDQGTAFGSP